MGFPEWQRGSAGTLGDGAGSLNNTDCKLGALLQFGHEVHASVLESASLTARCGRTTANRYRIYIGIAPAVSGRNLNRWLLRCLSRARQDAETLDSLPRSLISPLTTAHLRCARKTGSMTGLGRRIWSVVRILPTSVDSGFLSESDSLKVYLVCEAGMSQLEVMTLWML